MGQTTSIATSHILTRYKTQLESRNQTSHSHSLHSSELVSHGGDQGLHSVHPLHIRRDATPEDVLTAGPTASKHPTRLKRKMDLLISCELMISDIVIECRRRTGMIKGNPSSTIFPNPTSTCLTAVNDVSTSSAVLRISGFTPDLIRGVLSPNPEALLTSCKGGLSFLNENPLPCSSLGDMILTAVGRLFNPALAGRR